MTFLVWPSQVKEPPDFLWGVIGHCSVLALLPLDLWLTSNIQYFYNIDCQQHSELENGFSLCIGDVLVRRRCSARHCFAVMWKDPFL